MGDVLRRLFKAAIDESPAEAAYMLLIFADLLCDTMDIVLSPKKELDILESDMLN